MTEDNPNPDNAYTPRVSDYFPGENSDGEFEGDLISISSILNQDVEIRDFVDRTGEYGAYKCIQIILNNDPKVVNCGGAVVIKKLDKLRESDAFPITGKFVSLKSESSGRMYLDLI